ncbi:hypothetical protein FPT15_15230 [Pseudomonas sp. RGB]|nr:hypothetical protein FPT15_15230 [Pseudomonas sp. RGB]
MWELACVGAGLLANRVHQLMNRLTDAPLSRASPLPHRPTAPLIYGVIDKTPDTPPAPPPH